MVDQFSCQILTFDLLPDIFLMWTKRITNKLLTLKCKQNALKAKRFFMIQEFQAVIILREA